MSGGLWVALRGKKQHSTRQSEQAEGAQRHNDEATRTVSTFGDCPDGLGDTAAPVSQHPAKRFET